MAVEATGPLQCRIEYVGTVGCCNDDDGLVAFEAVHLYKQLVQGLFALVVAAAQTCTALAAYRVNFVDKDDTGRIFLCLFEHVADAACADTDKHFDKVRT